jgi:pimeloyl-ACP methyl ester carboxylesterase
VPRIVTADRRDDGLVGHDLGGEPGWEFGTDGDDGRVQQPGPDSLDQCVRVVGAQGDVDLRMRPVEPREQARHVDVVGGDRADVLAEFDAQRVTDAALVGHSCAGMVITAVADRIPDRVSALVYLDAFVPRDGESCWTLTNDEQRQWYIGVDATGYGVPPLPFLDERATAQPLASLLQPIRLDGEPSGIRRVFVYAQRWPTESPFAPTYERVRADPAWTTYSLDGAHNLMRDNPADLLRILVETAAGQ